MGCINMHNIFFDQFDDKDDITDKWYEICDNGTEVEKTKTYKLNENFEICDDGNKEEEIKLYRLKTQCVDCDSLKNEEKHKKKTKEFASDLQVVIEGVVD